VLSTIPDQLPSVWKARYRLKQHREKCCYVSNSSESSTSPWFISFLTTCQPLNFYYSVPIRLSTLSIRNAACGSSYRNRRTRLPNYSHQIIDQQCCFFLVPTTSPTTTVLEHNRCCVRFVVTSVLFGLRKMGFSISLQIGKLMKSRSSESAYLRFRFLEHEHILFQNPLHVLKLLICL